LNGDGNEGPGDNAREYTCKSYKIWKKEIFLWDSHENENIVFDTFGSNIFMYQFLSLNVMLNCEHRR